MTFEHLDDPSGFRPDGSFRRAAVEAGRRRRMRRRLALATGSVLTSVAVLLTAVAGYGLWRSSQVDRVDVGFAAPPVDLGDPFNVLLIGSDDRSDPAGDAGARSDTMIVVRVEPSSRRLVLLSLPRDLVVTPLGGGSPERLNTAFATGGPSQLVQTVEARLGIPLSAYVSVDFAGVVDLVDAVGGAPLSVTTPVRDLQTGLALEPSSCEALDGEQALALLRSRHLETLVDGRWVEDRSSDLGRMARQRAVLQALLPQLGRLTSSLGGIQAALDVLTAHVTIDARLDVTTLLSLGRWTQEGTPVTASEVTLPVTTGLLVDTQAQVLVLAPDAAGSVAAVGGHLPEETTSISSSLTVPVPAGSPSFGDVEGVVPIGPCP